MKLPDISELDFNTPIQGGSAEEKSKTKKSAVKKEEKVEQSNGKRKPRIPKSEYDENGNPILMIPDLDDVDLSNEIKRILG